MPKYFSFKRKIIDQDISMKSLESHMSEVRKFFDSYYGLMGLHKWMGVESMAIIYFAWIPNFASVTLCIETNNASAMSARQSENKDT